LKKKTTTLTGEKNINNGSPEKNIDHTKETNSQKSRTDNNLKKKKEQSEGMLKAIPLALLALSIFIALCFITFL
jgi:hypothetical protein